MIYVASSCVHNINGKFSNRRQVYVVFGCESSQVFFLFLNLIDVMCVLLTPNDVLYLSKIFKKFVMSFNKMQLFLVLALRQSIPVRN